MADDRMQCMPGDEVWLVGERRAPEGADLAELAGLDDAGFRALFAGSPIKRIGRNRFVRNVLIAIGNSGRDELAAVAEAALVDRALVWAEAVTPDGRFEPAGKYATISRRRRRSRLRR